MTAGRFPWPLLRKTLRRQIPQALLVAITVVACAGTSAGTSAGPTRIVDSDVNTGVNADTVPIVTSLLERRHAHVVIQQWDLSCGAAALTTLLKYQHAEPVTEKQVAASLMRRPEYIAHPDLIRIHEGFSLLDIKRDVDARGYKGSGYGSLTLQDLLEMAPLLVPLQINGYNHFVVFRGATKNHVLLADPAWGNRTMPVDQFLGSWIDYPAFGHVGFTVLRRDGKAGAGPGLAPVAADFTFVQ